MKLTDLSADEKGLLLFLCSRNTYHDGCLGSRLVRDTDATILDRWVGSRFIRHHGQDRYTLTIQAWRLGVEAMAELHQAKFSRPKANTVENWARIFEELAEEYER